GVGSGDEPVVRTQATRLFVKKRFKPGLQRHRKRSLREHRGDGFRWREALRLGPSATQGGSGNGWRMIPLGSIHVQIGSQFGAKFGQNFLPREGSAGGGA